jgi:hypothetical protein
MMLNIISYRQLTSTRRLFLGELSHVNFIGYCLRCVDAVLLRTVDFNIEPTGNTLRKIYPSIGLPDSLIPAN